MEIKSALELALERTKDIESDPEHIQEYESKQSGKKLAAHFVKDLTMNVQADIKKHPAPCRRWVKEGFWEVLMTYIALPSTPDSIQKLTIARKGCQIVLKHALNLKLLFDEIEKILNQYLENKQTFIEKLRAQFIHAQQQHGTGSNMTDPAYDPRFSEQLQKGMQELEQHYGTVLNKIKEELSGMFNSSK